ncbi:MAG: type II toxin-antitoxin system PemK/MazF family toxin [Ruminococcaceae bacterium]|nr:type II toxin-antitoxin system PemK/MazF family toxin [Oscillospiraceae bacterium]
MNPGYKAPQSAPAVRRGDIFYADLSPVVGSEQGGLRPVLIIQNDVGNRYSPTVIAAAITSRMGKTKLPTHIDIYADRVGLSKDSVILLEQIRTLDKRRLREKMGHLDDEVMEEVNNAIAVSFGLHEGIRRGEDHTEERERESPKIAPGVYHNPVNPPSPAELPEWDERPNVAAATVHKEDGENRSKG